MPAPEVSSTKPTKALWGSVSAAVWVLAVLGYTFTGSPGMPSSGPPGLARAEPEPESASATEPESPQASAEEKQFAAVVETLAQRMKEQPGNAEGWSMLARSYARLGRHADAVPAFEKAAALLPEDARLLADYADTLAMQNNGNLQGEPFRLLKRALVLEPQNPKALAMAGSAAFDRNDFAVAVRHWELLSQILPANSPVRRQLQSSIDEARAAGGLRKAGVQGTVRLASALMQQAAPTDTVFIYATAADGPRMPLAIQRHQVKDLPITFTLDDSSAMSPALRLSLHDKVVISARISKTGQARPTPGDLWGQTSATANTVRGVVVEINEVVKH